jgi:hypothetical protein
LLRLSTFATTRHFGRDWHLADIPIAAAFVRFRTKANNGGFWREMDCPLLTHLGHRAKTTLRRYSDASERQRLELLGEL